jgi:hypothetical protein
MLIALFVTKNELINQEIQQNKPLLVYDQESIQSFAQKQDK